MSRKRSLTVKQRMFIEAYLETLNATEAARRAKYKGSDTTLAAVGYENLRKPYIRAAIDERLKGAAMSADEVLFRLSKQAQGVDTTEFVELREIYDIDDNGNHFLLDLGISIKLEDIKRLGLGTNIKKISQTANGISIEWYDQQAALEKLGRYYGLFKDRIELDIKDLDVAIERELARLASRSQT